MQKSSTVALVHKNKVLLLKRGSTAPWNPDKYCLPGGKLEHNETLLDCAVRELSEETGIVLSHSELKSVTINYPKYSKIVFYATSTKEYSVKLNWEHSGYIWASIKEISCLEIVPGLWTTIQTLRDLEVMM